MQRFPRHPLHGIHDPTRHTPPRRPGSVQRTSSVDMTRDPGSLDPVFLHGHARDLYTAPDSTTTVLGTAAVEATVELVARVMQHLAIQPPVAGLHLVGAPAMSGFRNAVDKAAPELRMRRDLRYTLLDDLPVATLISGHALSASGVLGKASTTGYMPVADQCAGFVTGGLLMSSFARDEPTVGTGPVAPELRDPADPLSWHDMADLPVHGMRRQRRLDVWRSGRDVLVDAMFRDTYVRADGVVTVIHEYTLEAAVDPGSGVIVRAEATPRVLPWQECPGAVASARRIAGMRLDELHARVRNELHGTTTCTHLNDLLRSVADTAALIPALPTDRTKKKCRFR